MKFINQDLLDKEEEALVDDSTSHETSDTSVAANHKNEEEFSNLMKHSSKNYDSYWDKNNAFLRIFMIFLGLFIILGTVYFILLWKSSK